MGSETPSIHRLTAWGQWAMVSFEVFKRSPQPLKAGIVATAAFKRFMELSMYSQRCTIAGSVVACSACDLINPAASPYLSPCTLGKPKGTTIDGAREGKP